MSLCQHLKNPPTYKIEGGLCMNCNNFKCIECLNFNYKSFVYGKNKNYISRKIFIIENNPLYRCPNEYSNIKKYKDDDMLAICFNCIEKINNPSIIDKLKFFFTT